MKLFAVPSLALFVVFFSLVTSADQGETLENDSKETWGWRTAMITSLALTLATNPLDADEFSVTTMSGEDVAGIKAGFRWHQPERLMTIGGLNLTHYYHFGYNYWQSLDVDGQEGVNNVLEFIPVFRFSGDDQGFLDYFETSVGVSVFSRSSLNDKQFSTNFQFANTLAVGGYVMPKLSWSLQLQHYSNNSIKLPNNGINFYNLTLAYRY
ncbi:acyloxyacyl hydrolase [Bermanella sp. R86510]|uniref:acyloxyacyl hydrolase n=1 Tax=unclassified Bermanella TaxID=2627862 RepID=UPI0037C86083